MLLLKLFYLTLDFITGLFSVSTVCENDLVFVDTMHCTIVALSVRFNSLTVIVAVE